MTPELKIACEVIFQEHKNSLPIAWNKDVFRGRLSMGLCEKAKQTLLSKNVIYFTNRTKKTITVLNPSAAKASTFEEAVEIVENNVSVSTPALVPAMVEEQSGPDYIDAEISLPAKYTHRVIHMNHPQPELAIAKAKWYMKPFFFYVVWPVCAAIVGIAISFLVTEYIAEVIRF